MKHVVQSIYSNIDRFLTQRQGLFATKFFIKATQFWTITTAVIFGSYWYSGDRRPLGDLAWVWNTGRTAIVVISIACLIWRNWSFLREILGHIIFIYAALAITSYTLVADDYGKQFQGDIVRVAASSLAFYFMAMMSCEILRLKKRQEERGVNTDGVI